MMTAHQKCLQAAIRRMNPICGVVVSPSGRILAQQGDFDRYPGRVLVKKLIGSTVAAQRTYRSLKGLELTISREGLAIAVARKMPSDIAVITFDVAMASGWHEFERLKASRSAVGLCFDPATRPELLDTEAGDQDEAFDAPEAPGADGEQDDGLPLDLGEILLRRVAFQDHENLLEIYSNPEVTRWEYRAPLDERQVTQYAYGQKRIRLGHPLLPFGLAAVLKEEDRVIGDCRIVVQSLEDLQGEIGFAFHPDYLGRGLATTAVHATLGFAFRQQSLHRISATTYAPNERGRRLLERVGMRQEAHCRHVKRVGDQWVDALVYAMLDTEWSPTLPSS